MQISRLFEMVYLLLDRKVMTAGELAGHFEISTRTVYRDVEILAQAGIPIYASRGAGGGIRLTEQFVLNKSVLSEAERRGILTALHGMEAVGAGEGAAVLDKLSALFGGEREDWIEIDFTSWSPENPISRRFQRAKQAIFDREVLTFRYSGAGGETRARTAEPVKLVFRGSDWYLLAWCRLREDFRFFKLSRMDALAGTGETFPRRAPPPPSRAEARRPHYGAPLVDVEAEIAPAMSYRVRDEFPPERREELPEGGFLARLRLPEDEWLYEYLMTYGGALRVRAPERIRKELSRRHRAAWERNEEERDMELKQIASFQVDHTRLTEGMYTSRVDGDVVTYDIRMVRPNRGTYLGYGAIHSFEHLFATYVRSGPCSDQVIYAGPMGCRTGFYFLVRDMAPERAIALARETMDFIAAYEGPIPGATERECGNYREQDLEGARAAAKKMIPILKDWTVENLKYQN